MVLKDADSTPTITVRKNGSVTSDAVTITKRAATTGIYDCEYNPAGDVEGDVYNISEVATVTGTTTPQANYEFSWPVTVIALERGTDGANTTTPPTASAVADEVQTRTIARVTLVDTCTTNTDMRGTDNAALPGDAMALTNDEREAVAVTVESHLLDEGDSQMLVNAIVGAIGNTNIDQAILIAAIRADLERSGGNLNTLLARIAGTIRTAADDVIAETAQTADIRSGLATTTNVTDAKTAIIADTEDLQSRLPAALVGGRMPSDVGTWRGEQPGNVDSNGFIPGNLASINGNTSRAVALATAMDNNWLEKLNVSGTLAHTNNASAFHATGFATPENVTDSQTAIETSIANMEVAVSQEDINAIRDGLATSDEIAERLLVNPANKLLTNEDGFVTATNVVVSEASQAVTFTALIDEDEDQPVAGVAIRIGGRPLVTATNGIASVRLNPATYTATVIVPNGYREILPIEVPVGSADVSVPLDLVALATTEPATAPLTNVQLPTEDQYGSRLPNVTVKFTFLGHADGATITGTVINTPAPKASDSTGVCRVQLRRLANYKAEYTIPGDRQPKTVTFATGDTGADIVVDGA